jgi:hypothetical protein
MIYLTTLPVTLSVEGPRDELERTWKEVHGLIEDTVLTFPRATAKTCGLCLSRDLKLGHSEYGVAVLAN